VTVCLIALALMMSASEAHQAAWTREPLPAETPQGADAPLNVDPEFWVFLAPSELKDTPPAVRGDLDARSCRVLQRKRFSTPHNVVWGELERRGQRDLAVQCVTGSRIVTYVYWNGEAGRVERVPVAGRGLMVASPDSIRAFLDPAAPIDDDMPRAVDHDGIEAAVGECCSVIFYKHEGRWFSHPAAD
jgi:hypothetical protein